MDFKELIEKDLDVFINSEEFASEHIVFLPKVKKILNVVIDEEKLKERNKKEYEGLIEGDILYFIKEKDLGNIKIKKGDIQIFDNVPYSVIDVKFDLGLVEVLLQSNRT